VSAVSTRSAAVKTSRLCCMYTICQIHYCDQKHLIRAGSQEVTRNWRPHGFRCRATFRKRRISGAIGIVTMERGVRGFVTLRSASAEPVRSVAVNNMDRVGYSQKSKAVVAKCPLRADTQPTGQPNG
jgi:hypothetical protein